MGLFNKLFPKREIDPALRQVLIDQGKQKQLEELEKAIAEPEKIVPKKDAKALRGKITPEGESLVKKLVEEDAQKRDEDRFGAKALRVPVDTPQQKAVFQRQVKLAEGEQQFLPPAEFVPGEEKKFALRALSDEALGHEFGEEEQKIINRGLSEFNVDFLGLTQPVKIVKGPLTKEMEKNISKISKKVVSQKFRGDKLDLPPESLADIEKRIEALGLDKRTVRTFGDMENAAIELGATPDVLIRESITSRITDGEVVALKNLVNVNSQFISGAEKSILTDPALENQLRPKIQLAEQQIDDGIKKLIKGGTEAGRAVTAFRIMAKNNLDTDFWLRKAKKEMGGGELTSDIQSAIRNLIDSKDVNGLAEFVSMLRTPSFAEKAVTLWKAGLLTSPTTHLANIGGNVTMKALQLASDVPATTLDILSSVFTGKRTTTISPKTIASAVRGGLKGVKNAREFLRTGIYSDELLTKYDIPKNVQFKNKILNAYTRGVFRTLGAEDILFRQSAMEESLEKQSWLIAKNEGLSGKAFKARTAELLQTPTNEMVANAIDTAEWITFQSPNVLADMITGGKGKVAGKIKTAALKGQSAIGAQTALATSEIIAPFTKTPTNIAARLAEFSPLGFFKAMTRLIKPVKNRQKEAIEAFSRALTGTGIIWLGSYLAERGKMTGNVPTDPQERADFFADGKQPNSIRIGDNWYQLNRLSPFGNLLGLGAEISEISGEETEPGAIVARATGEAVKGLTEQTFLKGLSGGLKAVTEPERFAEKFAEQSVASIVPSIVGRIARTIDPVLRNPDGIIEAVKDRLPKVREDIAVRRDIFGEKIKVPGGKLTTVDPFSTKEAKDSPILKEAKEIGVTIGMPSQTIFGEKLTNKEYDVYQQYNGQMLKKVLDELVSDEGYKSLTQTERNEIFETTITTIRSVVNETVVPQLLKQRWGIADEVDIELMEEAIKAVNSDDRFKKLPDEKKADIIRQLVE